MYGFNLGQIEGLDSSVQTVTLTIANATESNTYTLSYMPLFGWTDSSSLETTTVALVSSYPNVDGFALIMFAYDASDVGQTYDIQINAETVEASFKSAAEKVIQSEVKIKKLYASYESVDAAPVGQSTDVPLYRDQNLTELASSSDLVDHDFYIIHTANSDGQVMGTYNPYYTFDLGSDFIAKWGRTSESGPYQPSIILGTVTD